MVTSIDMEGTKKGFELPLIELISSKVSIPVIASGGAGNSAHVIDLFKKTSAGAAAVASILHYNLESIEEIKEKLLAAEIHTRL